VWIHESQFIADDLSPLKSSARKGGPVTDQYLVELAACKGIKLATLDEGICTMRFNYLFGHLRTFDELIWLRADIFLPENGSNSFHDADS
jgi:hypothetical protein